MVGVNCFGRRPIGIGMRVDFDRIARWYVIFTTALYRQQHCTISAAAIDTPSPHPFLEECEKKGFGVCGAAKNVKTKGLAWSLANDMISRGLVRHCEGPWELRSPLASADRSNHLILYPEYNRKARKI